MSGVVSVVSGVVLAVLGYVVYFWVLDKTGLFGGSGWDDEPETDEHEDNLGVDR